MHLAHLPSVLRLVEQNNSLGDLGFIELELFLAMDARKFLCQSASYRVATLRANHITHVAAALEGRLSRLSSAHDPGMLVDWLWPWGRSISRCGRPHTDRS